MSDPNTLARLDALERSNRRLRRYVALLGGCIAVFGMVGFAGPGVPAAAADDEVRAQRFVLVDEAGAELGHLDVDSEGFPRLLLRKDRASATITLNHPSVHLRGDDGRSGAWLGQDTQGAMGLSLNGEKMVDGVRVKTKPDGSSGVYVLADDGREAVVMERLGDGSAAVSARDGDGVPRSFLGLTAAGIPSLILLDERGAKRLGAIVQPDGTPLVALDDERGQSRIELSQRFDGHARMRTFDADGETTFEAP